MLQSQENSSARRSGLASRCKPLPRKSGSTTRAQASQSNSEAPQQRHSPRANLDGEELAPGRHSVPISRFVSRRESSSSPAASSCIRLSEEQQDTACDG